MTLRRIPAKLVQIPPHLKKICIMKSERVRYFPGQLFTADNCQAEQTYYLNKLRRHNRYLHGWGVASGLEVTVSQNRVNATPGIAIDCAGNELFLDESLEMEIPSRNSEYIVTAEYREIETKPVPGMRRTFSESVELENERIRDYCYISLSEVEAENSHDSDFPLGSPGCGSAHPMILARLERVDKHWQVQLCNRR